MSLQAAFSRAIASLTPEQAIAVYNALAQWTDNQRNYVDKIDYRGDEVSASDREQLEAAELVVKACETALTAQIA